MMQFHRWMLRSVGAMSVWASLLGSQPRATNAQSTELLVPARFNRVFVENAVRANELCAIPANSNCCRNRARRGRSIGEFHWWPIPARTMSARLPPQQGVGVKT